MNIWQRQGSVRIRKQGRRQAKETEDSLAVKGAIRGARVEAVGTKKIIVRPKTKDDPPSLVHYIRISGEHYTADEAWKDARMRPLKAGKGT